MSFEHAVQDAYAAVCDGQPIDIACYEAAMEHGSYAPAVVMGVRQEQRYERENQPKPMNWALVNQIKAWCEEHRANEAQAMKNARNIKQEKIA